MEAGHAQRLTRIHTQAHAPTSTCSNKPIHSHTTMHSYLHGHSPTHPFTCVESHTHTIAHTHSCSHTRSPLLTLTCAFVSPSSSPMTRSHLWLSWSPLHVWTSRLQAISHGTPSAPGGDTEDPCDSSVLKWLCEPCYKKMKADNRWGHHSGGQPHFPTGGQSHLLESLPSQHLFEIILC